MSNAAIGSNQGDYYQKLVAMDWTLSVLGKGDKYEWIEVDSTLYAFDDVVIGKANGDVICCQCKKNQPTHTAWSINALSDDIQKALRTLTDNPKAEIYFYSRNNFGSFSKLKDNASIYADEAEYKKKLTQQDKKTDSDLDKLIQKASSNLTVFAFLKQINFAVTDGFDRYEETLKERLSNFVSNAQVAYEMLWGDLDKLGARRSQNDTLNSTMRHRLNRHDLQETLKNAGSIIATPINIQEAQQRLQKISAIGRQWKTDISGKTISNASVEKVLDAIDEGEKKSILMLGEPGSGKTCAMLALQKVLEDRTNQRTNIVSLFIQSRLFADCRTDRERQDRGLPENWLQIVSRLADEKKIIVIIDSLDVLSISRQHDVLDYFLTQMDQLLAIPNVILITACRNFDYNYDRRIAVRQWDYKVEHQPLKWENDVLPLLTSLNIDLTAINEHTKSLITNARNLDLFVEIAKTGTIVNVNSHLALNQKYLERVIENNNQLGTTAITAIEKIALRMLRDRQPSIPKQGFHGSDHMKHTLFSLNVLHDNGEGSLEFGHQSLMDVLVISGAIREELTLKNFIDHLAPVPFVRPFIRSFVQNLMTSDRSKFRRQVRAVFESDTAFHIQRLVAETYAEQPPEPEDWQIINRLKNKNYEVFQVIHTKATHHKWYDFWLNNLVPIFKHEQDSDGLRRHISLTENWLNEHPQKVLLFLSECLHLEWLNQEQHPLSIDYLLTKIETKNILLAEKELISIIEELSMRPQRKFSAVGEVLALCAGAGINIDHLLWQYITANITDDALQTYSSSLDHEVQLNCNFGNHNNFLQKRLTTSTDLLDIVIQEIERWNHIVFQNNMLNKEGFVNCASLGSNRTYFCRKFKNLEILMSALEETVIEHAVKHTNWWQMNKAQLYESREFALRYFAVLGCTKSPEKNLGLIRKILSNKEYLNSVLHFELGTLIKVAFIHLDYETQDAIQSAILTVSDHRGYHNYSGYYPLTPKLEYASTIPCHLRTNTMENLLNTYILSHGVFVRKPRQTVMSGTVRSPFSFKVFLDSNDNNCIKLMQHYCQYKEDPREFIGGKKEVCQQLREATSRQPIRFMNLLADKWSDIPEAFCKAIMYGLTLHIKYRFDNLRQHHDWQPLEEPDAQPLVKLLLEELARHSAFWRLHRSTAGAIKACSCIIDNEADAASLIFWCISYINHYEEPFTRDDRDADKYINQAIHSPVGNIAQSLVALAESFSEKGLSFPELLAPTLQQFANHDDPAIRALILRRLPYLQYKRPHLGWKLFDLAISEGRGLWQYAEECLLYSCLKDFDRVNAWLSAIFDQGDDKDLETWGRVSAFCTLIGKIQVNDLIDDLERLNKKNAWQGAASVWTHSENINKNHQQCFLGIEAGLKNEAHALTVAKCMRSIFTANQFAHIPVNLIEPFFNVLREDPATILHTIDGVSAWLNKLTQYSITDALEITEYYLQAIEEQATEEYTPYFTDYNNQFAQLLTRFFQEAEEREETDSGDMLRRVIKVQNSLWKLGPYFIESWLKEAEKK